MKKKRIRGNINHYDMPAIILLHIFSKVVETSLDKGLL